MKNVKRQRAHFTPFLRGAIYALYIAAGWTLQEIADEIPKSDGSMPTQQAVHAVVTHADENGGFPWDG